VEMVCAVAWLKVSGSPPAGLWLFLVLSFANGCVLELGRKIYAPANERPGVETYSALLGPRNARAEQAGPKVQAMLEFAVLGGRVGARAWPKVDDVVAQTRGGSPLVVPSRYRGL